MIDHKVILNYNYGYKWYGNNFIKVKGWIFDELGNSIQDEMLIDYFKGIDTSEKLSCLLKRTNGHFAVIIVTPDAVITATDRGRSLPLYYSINDGIIAISDSGFSLINKEICLSFFDEFSIQEYLAAGHVTGSRTLLKNVLQVGAGEIVSYSAKGIETLEYFKFLPDNQFNNSFEKAADHFVEILESDYRSIIKALNGRAVVIPLSGGYDSRSIASMFRRLGYSKVVCYSFGQDGSPEMITSKKVADALGYRWIFIETTNEVVRGFAELPDFKQYVDFAANASSFFIMQDFFAVKRIKSEGLVPDDSVFMPGHSGDTLGGSNFLELFSGSEEKDEMIKKIIKYRYDLNKVPKRVFGMIREKLESRYDDHFSPALWFDYWCMKEWNPKMFANGIRLYEFFGYTYLLPLWSRNLLNFFSNLPLNYRIGKELYEDTLESKIFDPLGVNFTPGRRKKFENKVSVLQSVKKYIKCFLPKSFIYRNFSYDPINAKLYTRDLVSCSKVKGSRIKYIGTNSIKAQWYIQYLAQKYKNQ